MKRLDEIVNALESNQQPLDETITLFEEGLKLVHDCDERLRQFENKVGELLAKNGSDDDDI